MKKRIMLMIRKLVSSEKQINFIILFFVKKSNIKKNTILSFWDLNPF